MKISKRNENMTDMTQILSHKMTSVIRERPFNF